MSLSVSGMDELLKKLDKLSDRGKVEEIAKKAVTAAEPVNEQSMKATLSQVESGPYATGSVSGSVSSTSTKVNEYGVYAVAKPNGRDTRGIRNAEKAAMLEYGSPGHLEPRPWRSQAASSAQAECIRIMSDIVRSEMGCD